MAPGSTTSIASALLPPLQLYPQGLQESTYCSDMSGVPALAWMLPSASTLPGRPPVAASTAVSASSMVPNAQQLPQLPWSFGGVKMPMYEPLGGGVGVGVGVGFELARGCSRRHAGLLHEHLGGQQLDPAAAQGVQVVAHRRVGPDGERPPVGLDLGAHRRDLLGHLGRAQVDQAAPVQGQLHVPRLSVRWCEAKHDQQGCQNRNSAHRRLLLFGIRLHYRLFGGRVKRVRRGTG